VTNLANGKSVEVRINDRGPFAEDRIIDLSGAAAKALELLQSGKATVRLEQLSEP
jgi:peptidoglycan lytic transglycosylase